MDKNGVLTINNWEQGGSLSPLKGNELVQNITLSEVDGAAIVNWKATAADTEAITSSIVSMTYSPIDGYFYAVDFQGTLWQSSSYGEQWNATGFDMAGIGVSCKYWKGYVWVATNSNLGVYPVGSSQGPANTSFQGLSNSQFHNMFVFEGSDEFTLYIGNGSTVASITEVAGQTLDITNTNTYNFNNAAVDLPTGHSVKSLSYLGRYLMIGTVIGENLPVIKQARIFPWDTVNSSFNVPIEFADWGVHQMINVNNTIYANVGVSGRWYATNLTSVQIIADPFFNISDNAGNWLTASPEACIEHDGRIFFAWQTGGGGIDPLGLYSLNPQNGRILLENTISNTASLSPRISAIESRGVSSVLTAWSTSDETGTVRGIDYIDTTERADTGLIRTQFYKVGLFDAKKSYKNVELELLKELRSGESIQIDYRESRSIDQFDPNGNFITLGIYTYTDYKNTTTIKAPISIPPLTKVQLQITITSSGARSPELSEVRLY